MRPLALILGASTNAMLVDVILPFKLEPSISALIGVLGFLFIFFKPSTTILRFSLIKGTESATVAMAANSINSSSLPGKSAWAIFNATPAPHKSGHG